MASDIATMESSWSIAILNTSEGRSVSFQHDTNRSSTESAEHDDLEFESVVAQTDLLTCCAQSAALQSSHATSILPVVVSQEPLHVLMIWRKSSVEAQRVAEFLL